VRTLRIVRAAAAAALHHYLRRPIHIQGSVDIFARGRGRGGGTTHGKIKAARALELVVVALQVRILKSQCPSRFTTERHDTVGFSESCLLLV